jgi:hypothetical protein
MAKSKHRVSYGENTNASAVDRAATDASRARIASSESKARASRVDRYKHVIEQKRLHAPVTRVEGRADAGAGMSYNGPKKAAKAPAAKKATTPAAAPKKPASGAPKPKARPSMSKGSATPPSYAIPKAKPQLGKKVSSGFQGNWTGAAPTDMQKRGGARKTGSGGILGAIKRKLGK